MAVPHTRGDEPRRGNVETSHSIAVPHTRGDEPTFTATLCVLSHALFPTRVGMNRLIERSSEYVGPAVPHTRGDEPCSPLMIEHVHALFPTRVGMNR